jgi:dTDP-4-dehydrorhamnose reductase
VILVFGRDGQVGSELKRLDGVKALGREDVDLTDLVECKKVIFEYRPCAVINAAAFTSVDDAEAQERTATMINGFAPATMAQACEELDIPLVHISTDYVFNGEGELPWLPTDGTGPKNAYGRTKLLGEEGVRASCSNHAILRTSWVFSSYGSNFVKTMLRLAESRDVLSIVADQVGGPTPARDIAAACVSIVKQLLEDKSKSGTYHFSGSPNVSWNEFAMEIFEYTNLPITLSAIFTSDYPTKAQRPLNSRLGCRLTEETFGISRPDWRAGLRASLSELQVKL